MENKERVILITGAGGELLQFDKPRHQLKKYSKIHGFKFEFEEFEGNYKLQKLFMIRKWLSKNYTVIWVDYDIKVNNYNINIMDNLKKDKSIFFASHKIKPNNFLNNIIAFKTYYNVANSGVMIFRNNIISKYFINDLWFLTKNYYLKISCWNDNSALLNLIGKKYIITIFSNFSEIIKLFLVPNKKNEVYIDYVGKLDICFNSILNINKITKETVFIHYAGIKNREIYLK